MTKKAISKAWRIVAVAAVLIGLLSGVKTLWFSSTNPETAIENPDSVIVKDSREAIRYETGVRELQPLENETEISRLPNGVFGYTYSLILDASMPDYLGKVPLYRSKKRTRQYVEIHKTSQGKVIALLYINQSSLVVLLDPNRENPLHTHAFLDNYKEYNRLVGIPFSRLIMWDGRSAELDGKEMEFVEIKIR